MTEYNETKSGILMPNRRELVLGAVATGGLLLTGCSSKTIGKIKAKPKKLSKKKKELAAPKTLKFAGAHKRLASKLKLYVPKANQTFAVDCGNRKCLPQFNGAMRDWKYSKAIPDMEDGLLDFLAILAHQQGTNYIQINSGYRTQGHQNVLIRMGLTTTKNSKHTQKRALDIGQTKRIKKYEVRVLADQFGWYSYSKGNFTHINT